MQLKKRTDIRLLTAIMVIGATIALGYSLSYIPDRWIGGHQQNYDNKAQQPSFVQTQQPSPAIASGALDPKAHQQQQLAARVQQLFNDSVQLMQIGHHQQALTKMHQLIKASPLMPEAHVNLGYIMYNLQRFEAAERSFNYALDIRADQANAYYGLALVAEARDDYQLALSAMRSYIHLTRDSKYLAKARAALWNWQTILDNQISTPDTDHAPQ